MTIPDPKRLGTFNAIDRSKQYTRSDNPELLRSLNDAWSRIRTLEQSNIRKDVELGLLQGRVRSYKFLNIALTSIITALALEGLKALVPIALRWVGF